MNFEKPTVIVLHYDEIALKKANRAFFEQKLVSNIKQLLKGNHIVGVKRQFGRIVISLGEDSVLNDVITILQNIPGINNISPAYVLEKHLDDMKAAVNIFDEQLKNAQTFAIDVRRPDRDFPINSMECERQLGGAVLEKFPDLKVQLKNPEVTIHYEIAPEGIYVYADKLSGQGGLPVGSSGKMMCLLSGGIDSPVAAYKMMVRGAQVFYVHFQNFTQDSKSVENKIEQLVQTLTKFQGKSKLFIVPFEQIQKTIIAHVPAKFRMIVYRRFMIQIAQILATKYKCRALITGDSVGQVASQTLENLTTVHAVADRFIASPLIGMNKRQIMDTAIEIGTYETSILPYDDCCSMFLPKHPATKSNEYEIEEFEKDIDVKQVMYDAIKEVKTLVIE